ncbi:MAG: DUF4113 domain-containing protein [Actinobacteria bacterium]|nr:DUF4113 domain-containing protein [Actinomycetota bacterium]
MLGGYRVKRDRKSPSYTTCWTDLIRVRSV